MEETTFKLPSGANILRFETLFSNFLHTSVSPTAVLHILSSEEMSNSEAHSPGTRVMSPQ